MLTHQSSCIVCTVGVYGLLQGFVHMDDTYTFRNDFHQETSAYDFASYFNLDCLSQGLTWVCTLCSKPAATAAFIMPFSSWPGVPTVQGDLLVCYLSSRFSNKFAGNSNEQQV
ncbi:hypothetical protein ABBQ38_014848 [Trebouxia sp. C0009 RCD-2024]